MIRLKEIFKILIVLLVVFSVEKVYAAASICTSNNITSSSFENKSMLDMVIIEKDKINYYYYEANGKVAYCQNAGLRSSTSCNNAYCTNEKFNCLQEIFDPTFEVNNPSKIEKMAYEAGVVNIVKSGPELPIAIGTNVESSKNYVATGIALRVYQLIWRHFDNNGLIESSSARYKWTHDVMKYYAKESMKKINFNLLNYLEEQLVMKGVTGAISYEAGAEDYADRYQMVSSDGVNQSNYIMNAVVTKVESALTASYQYLTNGVANITYKGPQKNQTDNETKITYNFEYTKFNSNPNIKVEFTCKNCDAYGVTVTTAVKNASSTKNGNVHNISINKTGNGKFDYVITFKSNNKDNFGSIDYDIKLIIYDKSISTQVFEIQDNDGSKSSLQKFYLLHLKDGAREIILNDSLNVNPKTPCTIHLENPTCSTSESNIVIKEGYQGCNSQNSDILSCIINNKDVAGNSYQATNLPNNKYCQVFCKEDYHFTMPGQKSVDSGRYFSLEASISGTKTCYTSKIDKVQFEKDYEKARQDLINKYNTWSKLNAIVNAPFKYVKSTGNHYNTGKKVEATCERDVYLPDGRPALDMYKNPIKEKYDCSYCTYVSTESCHTDQYKKDFTYKKCFANSNYCQNVHDVLTFGSATGTSSSCGSGSCSITTYTKDYNSKNYEGQLSTAKKNLDAAISYLEKLRLEYNSCSTWNADYNLDPEIKFWYEESYMNNVIKDTLDSNGNVRETSKVISRCTNDTNNMYDECQSGWSGALQMKLESKFVCYQSGNGYTCDWQNKEISQTLRMKYSITKEGNYKTPTQFYTIYPSGSIVVAEPGKNIENATELANKLPVGLGTSQGVYNYALMVSNLGEYYNSDKLGRIWGASDSVVVEALQDGICDNEENKGSLTDNTTINNTNLNNGVYTCAYKVNCPDCPVVCDPNGCENPSCPNNNCPVVCDNCVYTNNKTNINYRPITSDDLNPNDRELGKNWDHDNAINTALELKAAVTTKEIEASGNTIYDIDFNSNNNSGFALKVTMDSKMISKIRAYNDKYEDEEGYLNNTLKCYDYKNPGDGKTYKNVFCYSTFLDELLTDNDTKNNIKITVDRPLSESERKNYKPGGYFTTWTLSNTNGWNISTEVALSYKKNYGTSGVNIGPSWK